MSTALYWIRLHSINSRREIVVNVEKIESVIEINRPGYTDKESNTWVERVKGSQLRMDSNDYGEVAESVEQVMQKIIAVLLPNES